MSGADEFAELVAGPDEAIPLDRAWALISAHATPGLDVDAQLARIDDLAAGCPAPTLDALVGHLFGPGGFRGNAADYYDPRNSYLDEVLERRLGIPITLSVLAMEAGRRLGVPLSGVGMPGHFLLRDKVDPTVFVDAFGGGTLLDAAGCERLFQRVHGPGARLDPAWLAPVRRGAIVARLLANLIRTFQERNDQRSLRWALDLRARLPTGDADERRAQLRLRANLN